MVIFESFFLYLILPLWIGAGLIDWVLHRVIPLIAGAMVIMIHQDQGLAVFGAGSSVADFSVRLKEAPLSGMHLTALLCGIFILVGIPYCEEVVRCYRFKLRGASSEVSDAWRRI